MRPIAVPDGAYPFLGFRVIVVCIYRLAETPADAFLFDYFHSSFMIDNGKKEDEALDLLDGATALPVVPEVDCREYLIFGG